MNKENFNDKEIIQEEEMQDEIAKIAEELKKDGVQPGDELWSRAQEIYEQRLIKRGGK